MNFKKYLTVTCFILIFALSGCGRQEETGTRRLSVDEMKKMEKDVELHPTSPDVRPLKPETRVAPTEQVAGGPIMKIQPKMIEPEEIVLEEGEILVSDFESWPNNLGGEMGVYGALEPDWEEVNLYPISWVYEPITFEYDPSNVHAGKNSFRLVNGLGIKRDLTWGSFSMDLGPTVDLTVVPKKVESLDASGYKYLRFWAKGEKGTEKMEFLLRDAHALNYNPQLKYKLPDLTTEWQKLVVPLEELRGKVDLAMLDNIGIAFGKNVGNMQGDIAYIDDFVFTNNP